MTGKYDLNTKKPIAFWNRELSISPRDFFGSLGKAAISCAVFDGKGVAENLLDAAKDIAPQDSPAHAAWLLIYKSLQQSLSELFKEYEEFFPEEKIDEKIQEGLAADLEAALDDIEVGFDASFFDKPHQLALLEEIKKPLIKWLSALGMSEAQAIALHLRLKGRFVLALHQQWLAAPHEYACIEKALNSPFVKATKAQRDWMQYSAWLQEQSNERMFAEAFGLSQVYVPLRAYYDEKKEKSDAKLDGVGRQGISAVSRIVVDLHAEVEAWVRDFDSAPAVRIISGGPGSGKSSFGKMFAAFVAREIEEVPVIFVPLHHFDPSDDLISAMAQFVKEDRFLTGSPLDASEGKERLLIIFDGLDELSMQGKAAAETALFFVDEVINKIDKFNAQGSRRQVLITGRDSAVQSATNRLREKRQILNVLPYFISDDEAKNYVDERKLLAEDQRNLWWKNYGVAKGLSYDALPDELGIKRLTPITREPLLNYLVALSYERKKIKFSDQTTLNAIYKDLLHAVHERQWDHGCHEGSKHLDINQFIRVLEEIALAVWHGDGRTATVDQILKRFKSSNLTRYLEAFQEGVKKGVSRLLTAFYFRQSDQLQVGEKTFEFTHKSFGEYLTARRIVRSIKQVHTELMRHDEDPDSGFDEREALKRWVELCGPTTMDDYVFRFLKDEVADSSAMIADWQNTFARLIGFAVRNGMPMEQTDVSKFKEMMRQSRNAEESLMIIHYACAVTTKRVLTINWGDNPAAFGEWISRLKGSRDYTMKRLIFRCLAYLNLSRCHLILQEFFLANLVGANLKGAALYRANLAGAILNGATLERANLEEANLVGGNLVGGNLERADLEGADLEGANLAGAILFEANFKRAKLGGANLERANLGRAILFEAILKRAKLEGANLERANLGGANLGGANLGEANLKGVNLIKADLKGANLGRANLGRANLVGANLEGANLAGANLGRANLIKANLEGANLEGAILEGAILEDANLEK